MKINYNYVPYLDIGLLCICIALIAIMYFTYLKKNSRFGLLIMGVLSMTLATISSIFYNLAIKDIEGFGLILTNFLHDAYYGELILLWTLFDIYIYSLARTKDDKKFKTFKKTMLLIFCLYMFAETLSDFTHFGFYIIDNVAYEHFLLNPFMLFYCTYGIIGIYVTLHNKKKISRKIFEETFFLFAFCITIMCMQGYFNTTTFNNLTFCIPVISIFILLHNNGYDANTGTLGVDVFDAYIKELTDQNQKFLLITITLIKKSNNPIENKKLPQITSNICHYCDYNFKKPLLFIKNKLKFNAIIRPTNDNYYDDINKLFEYIGSIMNKDCYDYKITVLNYPNDILTKNYRSIINFNKYLVNVTPNNSVYYCQTKDKVHFTRTDYILEQLHDIAYKKDLDDERVLVYCQPIYNCEYDKYYNAETLMRLKLPELGVIPPNDFIPLAEHNGLIHHLSLIILNKACKEVKMLIDKGYNIDRVSINFSASEVTSKTFVEEIKSVVENNGITLNNISIEITESMFNNIDRLNEKMLELRRLGAIFYLDDFGTGYSNIDRISKLPFTIIKFDKSLLINNTSTSNSVAITKGLVKIFKDLNFHILFEGVETEEDEKICKEMEIRYLQGYKYSKPIPIEELKDFLSK